MTWCSLVGAVRKPKQAMPVARQEDLGLCVLCSLSLLSLQSSPRCLVRKWHCMFKRKSW